MTVDNWHFPRRHGGSPPASRFAWLLLLLIPALSCFGQQQPANGTASEAAQSAVRHGTSDSSLAVSTIGALHSFDLVPPAHFDSILSLLSNRGIAIDKNSVAAIGILHPDSDSAVKLFVVTLDQSGQPHRAEYILAATQKQTAPAAVAVPPSQLSSPKNAPKLRQDGRVYFMINCAVKSLFVYPSALGMAFPSANGQVLGGVSLLALGASLYGSYAFTRHMELGYGKVEMMNYGGDLGVAYPLLMAAFGESSAGLGYGDQIRGWGMMLGFPAGIFAGSLVKFAGNFDYGNASTMTSESKFGLLYGFLIPLYFYDFGSSEYVSMSTGLTMALIPAGFYVGKLMVGDGRISSGRSTFVTTSAVMGALTGALIPTLWYEKGKEIYATTTLLGHVAGTLFGYAYRCDQSYTFGQAMFMVASAAVGTAVCDAIPLIAQSKDQRVYTGVGIAGSWSGLMLGELLARTLFEKSARDANKTASVTFPGLWQLPLIWACSKSTKTGLATGNVSVIEARF